MCLLGHNAYSWGAWAHKHVNRGAVMALPLEMRTFYYNHIDFISEGAVVPDLRRGVLNDREEPPRHFIDIEDYNISIASMPKTWKEAREKYDSLFLDKSGYVPWYIQTLMDKLTTAFKRKNRSEIIFISAELGHYVGDAHVPLHTSSNHDGQLTNQKGIHSFWESQLPELFGNTYDYHVPDAVFIDDVPKETWKIIEESHRLVEITLGVERILYNSTPKEQVWEPEVRSSTGQFTSRKHTVAYAQKYHDALNHMVEKQMKAAITSVSNFWYTAWVNAGKPDLSGLDDEALAKASSKNRKKELKAWKKGKILNLDIKKTE